MKIWLWAVILTLGVMGLSVASLAKKSVTFDETAHIAAGYSYLATGDFLMNVEHPPLVKELAALPLLALQPNFPDENTWNEVRTWTQWDLGRAFLFQWNAPDRLVFWARVPIVLLFGILALLIFGYTRQRYGTATGFLALLLFLFNPDLLAHGQLVTTDLAFTLFTFATLIALQAALEAPRLSGRAVLWFALCLGLAVTTKFSAAILCLILVVLAVLYIFASDDMLQGFSSCPLPRSQRTQRIVLLALAGSIAAWVLIWAVFGFRSSLSPAVMAAVDWQVLVHSNFRLEMLEFIQRSKLLPEGYLGGFFSLFELLKGRVPYFFGHYTNDYWWCFFPATFLLKTPLPLLILLGIAICRRIRNGLPADEKLFLLLPVAIYVAIAILTRVTLGNRHLLPIYPFLIVWVAEAGRNFRLTPFNRYKALLATLVAWQVIGTLLVYPNFLTYFNELSGGPKNGYRYLVDSNFDWGQDLKTLAAFRERHAKEPLYVSYYGTADPRYYLRDVIYLPCYPELPDTPIADLASIPRGSLVAISATILMSTDMEGDDPNIDLLNKLRQMEPEERLGNSILVFRMP